jgi:hypothetical protein
MYHLHNPTEQDINVFAVMSVSKFESFVSNLPPSAVEQLLVAIFNQYTKSTGR